MSAMQTAKYGTKQELILKNLRSMAADLPVMEERLARFLQKELGVEPPTKESKSIAVNVEAAANVFDAINREVDALKKAMECMSKTILAVENSINPKE